MASLLDFSATNGFRKKLLTRNLTPYAKAPNRPTLPVDTEYVQTDSSVQDSPDQLIDVPSFANKLYPSEKLVQVKLPYSKKSSKQHTKIPSL